MRQHKLNEAMAVLGTVSTSFPVLQSISHDIDLPVKTVKASAETSAWWRLLQGEHTGPSDTSTLSVVALGDALSTKSPIAPPRMSVEHKRMGGVICTDSCGQWARLSAPARLTVRTVVPVKTAGVSTSPRGIDVVGYLDDHFPGGAIVALLAKVLAFAIIGVWERGYGFKNVRLGWRCVLYVIVIFTVPKTTRMYMHRKG
ncbi:hypothetical protein BC936DRAFT_146779, partial [Jimgerdemannia flammicorona]